MSIYVLCEFISIPVEYMAVLVFPKNDGDDVTFFKCFNILICQFFSVRSSLIRISLFVSFQP